MTMMIKSGSEGFSHSWNMSSNPGTPLYVTLAVIQYHMFALVRNRPPSLELCIFIDSLHSNKTCQTLCRGQEEKHKYPYSLIRLQSEIVDLVFSPTCSWIYWGPVSINIQGVKYVSALIELMVLTQWHWCWQLVRPPLSLHSLISHAKKSKNNNSAKEKGS